MNPKIMRNRRLNTAILHLKTAVAYLEAVLEDDTKYPGHCLRQAKNTKIPQALEAITQAHSYQEKMPGGARN